MRSGRRQRLSMFIGVLVCVSGCAGDIGVARNEHALFSLSGTMTLDDARHVVGEPRFQFLAADGGDAYCCVTYILEDPYASYCVVFRNESFLRMFTTPPFDREIVQRGSARVGRRRPVDADARVRLILETDGVSGAELRSAYDARTEEWSEDSNVRSAFIVTAPLRVVLAPFAILDRHEPVNPPPEIWALRIGMSVEEAEAVLGAPQLVTAAHDSMFEMRAYGSARRRDATSEPSLVVRFAEGVIDRVYANDFVEDRYGSDTVE